MIYYLQQLNGMKAVSQWVTTGTIFDNKVTNLKSLFSYFI